MKQTGSLKTGPYANLKRIVVGGEIVARFNWIVADESFLCTFRVASLGGKVLQMPQTNWFWPTLTKEGESDCNILQK